MSRWIGDDHIDDVLQGSDSWRERCFLADGSLFGNEALWTLDNIRELKRRFLDNPIKGAERTFYEKLKDQLEGASSEVIRLAAELVWLLLLFPDARSTKPDTKLVQIREVWEWSGTALPESPYFREKALLGVGHPGTAYLTRRYEQFAFMLEVVDRWKALTQAEQTRLMNEDVPWLFMEWLDQFDKADRRPVRNAILYFLFPDHLERNLSNGHRRQIVNAMKHRLPEHLLPRGRNPPLQEMDRAISELRKGFEVELGSKELDFYRPPLHSMWFSGIREKARTEISTRLKRMLSEYDLELRQCGSKKKTLHDCKPTNETTGFWDSPTDASNKPLRWLLHLELVKDRVIARVPNEHGARRIAFANTAQGTSGGVTTRIVPAIQLREEKFVFYETWEWLLLYCFLPALPAGSSGQLFDKFDETSGSLTYMGKEQQYIAASLITLQDDDNEFSDPDLPRAIKYSEATEAIAKLIHIAPADTAPVGKDTE